MEYVIGLIVGCIVSNIIFWIRHPVLGRLEVDEREPDNLKWRFVITGDVDFSKTKHIILKVDHRVNPSQK